MRASAGPGGDSNAACTGGTRLRGRSRGAGLSTGAACRAASCAGSFSSAAPTRAFTSPACPPQAPQSRPAACGLLAEVLPCPHSRTIGARLGDSPVFRSNPAANSTRSASATPPAPPDDRRVAVVYRDVTARKRREANAQLLAEITSQLSQHSTIVEITRAVGRMLERQLKTPFCDFVALNAKDGALTFLGYWDGTDASTVPDGIQISNLALADAMVARFGGHNQGRVASLAPPLATHLRLLIVQ